MVLRVLHQKPATIRNLQTCATRLMSASSLQDKNVTNPSAKRQSDMRTIIRRREYRFGFPEFLPDCDRLYRNPTRELLERKDMLARRDIVDLPEFYVGSIVAVTTSVPEAHTKEKQTRLVGIVISRGGTGLCSWMIVRNVVDHQGVEFMFNLYAPTVRNVEVLRLEKRLDEELLYLRDADPKYSTFPMDMTPEILADGQEVPINDEVIPLTPPPWTRKWERYADRLHGYSFDMDELLAMRKKKLEIFNSKFGPKWHYDYYKYDLMRDYFLSIPIEEQDSIWTEVAPALERRSSAIRRQAAKKALLSSAKDGSSND